MATTYTVYDTCMGDSSSKQSVAAEEPNCRTLDVTAGTALLGEQSILVAKV